MLWRDCICFLQQQYSYVNSLRPRYAYMHQLISHHPFRQWRQVIIWSIVGISSIGPLKTKFKAILIEIHASSLNNAFENTIWKMVAIFSRPHCVRLPKKSPILHIFFPGNITKHYIQISLPKHMGDMGDGSLFFGCDSFNGTKIHQNGFEIFFLRKMGGVIWRFHLAVQLMDIYVG